MKSFLAGLGLGIAAAVAYSNSRSARRPQKRPEAASPARTSGQNHPSVSVAAAPRARNAEEVLNSATRQQLLSVYGIGPVLADRIMQNRPYASAYDVVEQGIIPQSIFIQLRKQLLEQPGA